MPLGVTNKPTSKYNRRFHPQAQELLDYLITKNKEELGITRGSLVLQPNWVKINKSVASKLLKQNTLVYWKDVINYMFRDSWMRGKWTDHMKGVEKAGIRFSGRPQPPPQKRKSDVRWWKYSDAMLHKEPGPGPHLVDGKFANWRLKTAIDYCQMRRKQNRINCREGSDIIFGYEIDLKEAKKEPWWTKTRSQYPFKWENMDAFKRDAEVLNAEVWFSQKVTESQLGACFRGIFV